MGHVPLSPPSRVGSCRGVRVGGVCRRRADGLDDELSQHVVVGCRGARSSSGQSSGSGGRRRPARRSLLAAAVACQALAGEPVSLAATLAIAAAYVVCVDHGWAHVRAVVVSAAGLTAGVLLAAIQFVPLAAASRLSVRGLMRSDDTWAFHPLTLTELVVPHFFGDYFTSHLRQLVWMVALNSNREPFYYTMYVGVPIVLAAAIAALSGRRQTLFWTLAMLACLPRLVRPVHAGLPGAAGAGSTAEIVSLPGEVSLARLVQHRGACHLHRSVADRPRRAAPTVEVGADRGVRDKRRDVCVRRLAARGAVDSPAVLLPVGALVQGALSVAGRRVPDFSRPAAGHHALPEAALRRLSAVAGGLVATRAPDRTRGVRALCDGRSAVCQFRRQPHDACRLGRQAGLDPADAGRLAATGLHRWAAVR